MAEYATNEYLFPGVSLYEKGVGCIYSQRRGRGLEKISWDSAPEPLRFSRYFLAPLTRNYGPLSLLKVCHLSEKATILYSHYLVWFLAIEDIEYNNFQQ